MVFHVGFSPFYGYLMIYDSINKVTINERISLVYYNQFNKINSIFDEVKSKVNGPFGCACIEFDHNYEEEFRNILISCCKDFGFQKVEFTDLRTTIFWDTISQTDHIPKKGNVIGQIERSECHLFQRNIGNVKYLGFWKLNSDGLEENSLSVKPNAFFYQDNDVRGVEYLRKKFPESEFFEFHKNIISKNGSIIQARMMAGDDDDEMNKYNISKLSHHKAYLCENYIYI